MQPDYPVVPEATPGNYAPPPPPIPTPLARATVTPQLDPTMANLFATMQANMEAMRLQLEQATASNYSAGGRGRGGRGRGGQHQRGRTPGRQPNRRDDAPPPRRRGGSYCHTHRNCAHAGVDCRTPGPNHQPTATFANMMNGATTNCE
jgi:hypothetical protein